MSSPPKPLTSGEANTSVHSPTKATDKLSATLEMDDANKPKSMEYHRQVLQNRLTEDKSKKTYISPSDNIMSPCTAKLSAYKSKHFMKAKPQSLFAKMDASKRAEAARFEEEKDGVNDGP